MGKKTRRVGADSVAEVDQQRQWMKSGQRAVAHLRGCRFSRDVEVRTREVWS